ncbi:MAG: hypothetical protein ACOVVK_00535 [Elsteraceae bacterium]
MSARSAHVPERVMRAPILRAPLTLGRLGYTFAGNGKRHRIASAMLVSLLTLALGDGAAKIM